MKGEWCSGFFVFFFVALKYSFDWPDIEVFAPIYQINIRKRDRMSQLPNKEWGLTPV